MTADPPPADQAGAGEVIDLLEADLDLVLDALRRQDTPFWRRTCARVCVSYAESLAFHLKQMAMTGAAARDLDLSGAERAMLADERYEVTNNGRARTTIYHPKLRSNLKFAFALAARALGVDFAVDYSDPGWERLKRAIDVRNRIAHPRDPQALQVTDGELEDLRGAVAWVREQVRRLQAAPRRVEG